MVSVDSKLIFSERNDECELAFHLLTTADRVAFLKLFLMGMIILKYFVFVRRGGSFRQSKKIVIFSTISRMHLVISWLHKGYARNYFLNLTFFLDRCNLYLICCFFLQLVNVNTSTIKL